jgi:hypothetical protein
MKSTKHQAPSTRETSSSKLQAGGRVNGLMLETWSFSGAWMLEFGVLFS